MSKNDQYWMKKALDLAISASHEQVPVGAIVVSPEGNIIGTGVNQPPSANDPVGHAEIMALREAGEMLSSYRLPGCTFYVTVEPCAMCAGALVHARIARLVFGAREPRAGAVVSHLGLLDKSHLNHRVIWTADVMAESCAQLIQDFFRRRRRAEVDSKFLADA